MTLSLLQKRCVELSYRHGLTHVSSVLNTVDLINKIYDMRMPHDPFVLANGHASLAHYVVLESVGMCDAEKMIKKHGVHSSRDMEHGIWVSNGSLGQAETVAVGLALADPVRKVWLVTSDGSCMEGSVYEAMRVRKKLCPNLLVHIVHNGLGAYGPIAEWELPEGVYLEIPQPHRFPAWLRGLPGHYLQLSKAQYEELMT